MKKTLLIAIIIIFYISTTIAQNSKNETHLVILKAISENGINNFGEWQDKEFLITLYDDRIELHLKVPEIYFFEGILNEKVTDSTKITFYKAIDQKRKRWGIILEYYKNETIFFSILAEDSAVKYIIPLNLGDAVDP